MCVYPVSWSYLLTSTLLVAPHPNLAWKSKAGRVFRRRPPDPSIDFWMKKRETCWQTDCNRTASGSLKFLGSFKKDGHIKSSESCLKLSGNANCKFIRKSSVPVWTLVDNSGIWKCSSDFYGDRFGEVTTLRPYEGEDKSMYLRRWSFLWGIQKPRRAAATLCINLLD